MYEEGINISTEIRFKNESYFNCEILHSSEEQRTRSRLT